MLFGVPAVVLLLLPLVCFAVGYWLQDWEYTVFLLVVVISWVEVPATIFGKPFFEQLPRNIPQFLFQKFLKSAHGVTHTQGRGVPHLRTGAYAVCRRGC